MTNEERKSIELAASICRVLVIPILTTIIFSSLLYHLDYFDELERRIAAFWFVVMSFFLAAILEGERPINRRKM